MTEAAHRDTSALIIGGTRGPGLAFAEGLVAEGCTRLVMAGRDAARGASSPPVDLEERGSVVDFDQHVAGSHPE